jgi:hypothetical protein
LRDTEPWDHPDKLLVTLCEACHQRETDEMPQALYALRTAVQDAWLAIEVSLFASAFGSADESSTIDSTLLDALLLAVLLDPRIRQATLQAYIEAFDPVAPLRERLEAQIESDAKASSEYGHEA